MFTLFFGIRDFVSSCLVDGQNVQDYLQFHYIEAFKQIAIHTKDMSNVLELTYLNEPTVGFIGLKLDGSNLNFNELIGYAFTPNKCNTHWSWFYSEDAIQRSKRFRY